jgi:hypothetical protein
MPCSRDTSEKLNVKIVLNRVIICFRHGKLIGGHLYV